MPKLALLQQQEKELVQVSASLFIKATPKGRVSCTAYATSHRVRPLCNSRGSISFLVPISMLSSVNGLREQKFLYSAEPQTSPYLCTRYSEAEHFKHIKLLKPPTRKLVIPSRQKD